MTDAGDILECSRRGSFAKLGIGGAALLLGASGAASAASPSVARPVSAYANVSLKKQTVTVAVVQIDHVAIARNDRASQLTSLVERIDAVQTHPDRPDLIHLGRFPAASGQSWTRADAMAAAIDLGGAEFGKLTAAAVRNRCILTVECLARDPDWPGHVLDLGLIIGPNGRLLAKQWRAGGRDLAGHPTAITTIDDVRARFLSRYGEDALVPVCRTAIGNIAMLADNRQPLIIATQVLKGAEIMIFSGSTGQLNHAGAATADAYGVFAIDLMDDHARRSSHLCEAGDTPRALHVIGSDGAVRSRWCDGDANAVVARLDIGRLRSTHTVPEASLAALAPALDAYRLQTANQKG